MLAYAAARRTGKGTRSAGERRAHPRPERRADAPDVGGKAEAKKMAFDERLAERIRKRLERRTDIAEKRMFGGVAFLLNGNMCCGVHGKEMIVRLDPEQTDQALAEPHTRRFDLTGRPMKGWILVAPDGIAEARELDRWLRRGSDYAASLPPK